MSKVVYRVECEDRGGPYRGGKCNWGVWELHRQDTPDGEPIMDACPNPRMGEKMIDIEDAHCYHFGFESFDQAAKWFRPYARRKLKRNGYRLSVYEAKDVHILNKQLIFDSRSCRKIADVSLNKLEKFCHAV